MLLLPLLLFVIIITICVISPAPMHVCRMQPVVGVLSMYSSPGCCVYMTTLPSAIYGLKQAPYVVHLRAFVAQVKCTNVQYKWDSCRAECPEAAIACHYNFLTHMF